MDGIAAVLFFSIVLFLFCIIAHEVEEIVFQHEWVQKNAPALKQRFPKLEKVFDHLLTMDTKAFAFAVIVESIVIVLAIYLSIQRGWDLFLFGIFLAYTLHLLVHIIQGCLIRRYVPGMETSATQNPSIGFFSYIYTSIVCRHYVPGLITAGILFPICAFCTCIWGSFNLEILSFLLSGLAGICFLSLNLLFSHWIGKKISSLF